MGMLARQNVMGRSSREESVIRLKDAQGLICLFAAR
jgi:hypothetical protein